MSIYPPWDRALGLRCNVMGCTKTERVMIKVDTDLGTIHKFIDRCTECGRDQ